MNTALWVAQILLAIAFLFSGLRKFSSYEQRVKTTVWMQDYTPTQVRLIGIVEVLGAIGLTLPALTGILPILTPLAAAELILTMLGAMVTNLRHHLSGAFIANVVLLLIAAFVIYGRLIAVPL